MVSTSKMLSARSSSHEKQPVNKPCYQSTLFTTTGTEKWNVLTKQCSAENLQRRRNTAAALQQRGEGAKAPIADDGSAATRALRKTKTRLHFLRRGNVPSPRRVGSLPNILEHYTSVSSLFKLLGRFAQSWAISRNICSPRKVHVCSHLVCYSAH